MDPNTFTATTQSTLQQALDIARTHKHPMIEPLHLLMALTQVDGPAKQILTNIDNQAITKLQDDINTQLSQKPTSLETQQVLSKDAGSLLSKAQQASKDSGDEFLAQEMLLLAASQTSPTDSLLRQQAITSAKINQEIKSMRQGQSVSTPTQDTQYQALEKYTTNFTQLAQEGKLDPVIGRDSEIRRVMQVLSRRTKNNPVLIGEPGVGKTAIAEGLAQRIVSGDVPSSLKNKQILSLEISSVLAGAKYRGEFEERFKTIIDEVQKKEGQVVLFVDELHTIAGAGSGGQGAVDAANMLKPGLARGTLRVIGATTLNEYRQYIEKDAALERRFQPVMVNPPSVDDTISILRGLKEKYEVHHGIKIKDDALVAASKLSDRYITDRFLPDKAIDLVDEAASALKIITESEPETIDNLKREITQLEIEIKALSKEKNGELEKRLNKLKKQRDDLKEKQKTLIARWQHQREILENLQQKRNQLDEYKAQLEKAEREVNLDEAAKIKYGDIPQIQNEIELLQSEWDKIPQQDLLVKQTVSSDDIATVVAKWTGIPVTKLVKSEQEKLTHLEDELHKRVIGQDEALKAVANAIRRSRAGMSEEDRPIASFMFLGPTGVGKTETAKALAEILFDDESRLVRIDMSEYSERHSLARLIGSPPGYVGYEEGGQLTEVVRRQPYSVILFDEIEKAHPQIFNLFLQIFDEGRLTDGQGRTVNFKNSVMIMTSNLGAKLIQEAGDRIDDAVQDQVWKLVQETYPPEFINRLDQVIMYEPLSKEEIAQITDLQLEQVKKRLADQGITLNVTPQARQLLAQEGYDPIYGARPLKRVIQTYLLDPLAMMILENDKKTLDVTTKVSDGKISLE